MKKVLMLAMALVTVTGASYAASIIGPWGYAADPEGNLYDAGTGANWGNGWLVQLYQDVNRDSVLSNVQSFVPVTGAALGSADVADDIPVGAITSSLFSDGSFAYWGDPTKNWNAANDLTVYTVIFNASSLANNPTQAIVVDSSTRRVPLLGPTDVNDKSFDYTISQTVAGSWVPVPEPGSLALMGIGAMIIGARKVMRK